MRRAKPISVVVKAPTRGLVTRLPGQTADYLPQQGQALIPGTIQRAASRASNVRYEDGVVCNAPGYEKVVLTADILSGLIAQWNLDELDGTRFDSTADALNLTEEDGVDFLESTPPIVSFEAGIFNNAALFESIPFAVIVEDDLTLDSGFDSGYTAPERPFDAQDNLVLDSGIDPTSFYTPVDTSLVDSLKPDSTFDSGIYTETVETQDAPQDKMLHDEALDSGSYVQTVFSTPEPEDKLTHDETFDSGSYVEVVIVENSPEDKLTHDETFDSGSYVRTVFSTPEPEDKFTLTAGFDSGIY